MSSIFAYLATYALNAVWLVPFFWFAGWCFSRFVKRADLELQHKLWVAILILATIAPVVPVIRPYVMHAAEASRANGFGTAAANGESGQSEANTSFDFTFSPNVVYLVCGLYITAFLFFLMRLSWIIRRTALLVNNARPTSTESEWSVLWKRSKEVFSVQEAVLLHSTTIASPVAAGFRRPILLLPDMFIDGHSQTEFVAAIGHECAHIQRNDFWKNVFYETVSLLTAFHPLTWIIKSQISQTREMICDQMAADRLLDRQTYAGSLLQIASKISFTGAPSVSHALGMFDSTALEKRIVSLTKESLPTSRGIRRHFSASLTIVVLSVCTGASWFLAQAVAQTPAFSQTLKKLLGREDLTCTYYDNKTKSFPGTCWFDEKDKATYRCYLNKNPQRSNFQEACEWKVQRALNSQK